MSESAIARGIKPPSRLGIPNSEEQKEKIRATHKKLGIKPPPMYGDENPSRRPEVRAKISKSLTGKKLSEEHKKSLSKNHRKVNPPGMRAKISKANRARIAAGTHHWWKGGITPKIIKIRNSTKYGEWRTSVFERDDYTCQECGKRGGKLNAHHIKPFSEFPELRFELNNGLTLCKECHLMIHSNKGMVVYAGR